MVPGSSDVRSWRFVGLSSNDLELELGIGFIDSLGLIFERFSVLSWRSDSFSSSTVVTIVTVGLDSIKEVSTPTPTTDSSLGREGVVMRGIKGVSMLIIAIGLEGVSLLGLEGISAAGLESITVAGLEGMSATGLGGVSMLVMEQVKIDVCKTLLESPAWFSSVEH